MTTNHMIGVARTFRFEAAHRLFNYDGKCANLHGHSYVLNVSVRLTSARHAGGAFLGNHNDMLIDFGVMKNQIKGLIDDCLDHNVILAKDDPLLDSIVLDCDVTRAFTSASKEPVILDGRPTAENILHLFLGPHIKSAMLGTLLALPRRFNLPNTVDKPDVLALIELTLHETENCSASYSVSVPLMRVQ